MSDRTATSPNQVSEAEQIISEVFLTPRVLDEGAFGVYAAQLKDLIRDSARQGKALERFVADASRLVQDSENSGETLKKKVEAGAKLLSLIDKRVDRVEQALRDAADHRKRAEELDQRLREITDVRLVELTERVEGIFAGFAETAEALESRLRVAEGAALRAAERTERAAAELTDGLEGLEDRARAIVDAASTRATQITDAIEPRLKEIEGRGGVLVDRACSATADLADHLAEVDQRLDAKLAEINAMADPVRDVCRRAFELLGMDHADPNAAPDPERGLPGVIARGEKLLAQTTAAGEHVRELAKHATAARQGFDDAIVAAAERMDELESRREALDGPVIKELERIRATTPDLIASIENAKRDMRGLLELRDALKGSLDESAALADQAHANIQNTANQLKALVDGANYSLSQRVEDAGAWLGGIITRAERSAEQIQRLLEQQRQADPGVTIEPKPADATEPPPAAPVAAPEPTAPPADQHPATPEPVLRSLDRPLDQQDFGEPSHVVPIRKDARTSEA